MDMHRALSEIREIGDILARARPTTCFRPLPVAINRAIALVASALVQLGNIFGYTRDRSFRAVLDYGCGFERFDCRR